jgi:hypothetical protein
MTRARMVSRATLGAAVRQTGTGREIIARDSRALVVSERSFPSRELRRYCAGLIDSGFSATSGGLRALSLDARAFEQADGGTLFLTRWGLPSRPRSGSFASSRMARSSGRRRTARARQSRIARPRTGISRAWSPCVSRGSYLLSVSDRCSAARDRPSDIRAFAGTRRAPRAAGLRRYCGTTSGCWRSIDGQGTSARWRR